MSLKDFFWIAVVLTAGAQALCFLTGLILNVWWTQKQDKERKAHPPVYRARWKVPRAEVRYAEN